MEKKMKQRNAKKRKRDDGTGGEQNEKGGNEGNREKNRERERGEKNEGIGVRGKEGRGGKQIEN